MAHGFPAMFVKHTLCFSTLPSLTYPCCFLSCQSASAEQVLDRAKQLGNLLG